MVFGTLIVGSIVQNNPNILSERKKQLFKNYSKKDLYLMFFK